MAMCPMIHQQAEMMNRLDVARLKTICLKLVSPLIVFVVLSNSVVQAQDARGAGAELHKLFESEWQRTLRESPTRASDLGDRRYNTQWDDVSLLAVEKNHEADKAALKRLNAIEFDQLSTTDKVNFRLFQRELEMQIEGQPFGWHLLPLNQRGGIQTDNSLAESLRFETVKDY